MAEFTSHIPGTFCWPELSTTDQAAGVSYYRSLFGWDVRDQPVGPGQVYSMFQLHGKDVAAAATMQPDQRQQGVPPHWGAYIAVASADETSQKAQSVGGKVLAPAFDVMDAGRMAVLQDPTGAVFSVWQGKRHIGVGVLNEPGALCWTELATRDTAAAEQFYTQLLGWTAKTSDMGGGNMYTEFSNQGKTGAGMMKMNEQMAGIPPHWLTYFQVADCDVSTARGKQLGGRVNVGPMDIPNVGRFSVLADPQGAVFALFKPARA